MNKGMKLTGLFTVIIMLLLLGIRWAERENKFDLTYVRIDNSSNVDSTELATVLHPYFGVSLLKIDMDSLEMKICTVEGVDSVLIEVHYPSTINILFSTGEPVVVLAYPDRQVPVTNSGTYLPESWVNDQLPVIGVSAATDTCVILTALNLLLKYNLANTVEMQVSNRQIVITEGSTRIILDTENAVNSWLCWLDIKRIISDNTYEVDLRFNNQAVLRSAEET